MTTYENDRVLVFRLPPGVDLLAELTRRCDLAGVGQAVIHGIGAVKNVEIAHYSFESQEYHRIELPGELELLALNGNVSRRDDALFVHAHVQLGDREGRVWGGHLFAAEVLVAEIAVQTLGGQPPLEREADLVSGLKLWPLEDI